MGRFLNTVAGTIVCLSTLGVASAQNNPTPDRPYEAELLSDVATRPSMTGTAGSGHDGAGFFIAGDKGFRLNIGGDIQTRYTANFGSDPTGDDNDFEGGFSTNLARLRLSGEANGFDFMLTGAFRNESDFALEDAYAGHSFGGGRVQFGQFQLPFLRENGMDDRFLLATDESITSSIFGQGYSQGVQGSWDVGSVRLIGAFSDGFSTANTDFNSDVEQDLALTFRAEWTAMGERGVFNDFTSLRGSGTSLLFGAAGHFEDGDDGRMYTYTGDASFESGGFNAFAAAVGRTIEEDAGSEFNDWGAVGQAGYRITENIEFFGRYDGISPDEDRGLEDYYSFATAGVNYYMAGHAAKFTANVVYSFENTTGFEAMNDFGNTGLLGSSDEGEIAVVGQVQILF